MSTDYTRDKYDRDQGEMQIECDQCGDTVEFYGSFSDCIRFARDEGWIVFVADDDEWVHLCSNECRKSMAGR